jgi:transcriptional regulator with XRE-family HTH domain
MSKESIPTNGPEIRKRRRLAGWNPTPFATQVGISPGYLSRLETGKRKASPATLKRIADALGAAMQELMPQDKAA